MPGRHEGWTREASSALALAGFLFLVFCGFTLLAMGRLIALDAYFNLAAGRRRGWVPVLQVLDRVGQRAVCLPVLAVVVWACCRRHGVLAARAWSPPARSSRSTWSC